MLGYFPADLAVLDPERTDGGIGAGNGEAGVRHGMGEAGGVKIQADPFFFSPLNPRVKVAGLQGVQVHLFLGIGIGSVKAQLMIAGNH